jgi:hypothetical protein
MATMFVATQSFTAEDKYGPIEVVAGRTHVADDHPLLKSHPHAWRRAHDRASQARSQDAERVRLPAIALLMGASPRSRSSSRREAATPPTPQRSAEPARPSWWLPRRRNGYLKPPRPA